MSPYVNYVHNLQGPDRWSPYQPKAVALRTGLLFSTIDGDVAGQGIKENRDFGLLVGTDFQFDSGWVFNITGYAFSADELCVEAGLGYHF